MECREIVSMHCSLSLSSVFLLVLRRDQQCIGWFRCLNQRSWPHAQVTSTIPALIEKPCAKMEAEEFASMISSKLRQVMQQLKGIKIGKASSVGHYICSFFQQILFIRCAKMEVGHIVLLHSPHFAAPRKNLFPNSRNHLLVLPLPFLPFPKFVISSSLCSCEVSVNDICINWKCAHFANDSYYLCYFSEICFQYS